MVMDGHAFTITAAVDLNRTPRFVMRPTVFEEGANEIIAGFPPELIPDLLREFHATGTASLCVCVRAPACAWLAVRDSTITAIGIGSSCFINDSK